MPLLFIFSNNIVKIPKHKISPAHTQINQMEGKSSDTVLELKFISIYWGSNFVLKQDYNILIVILMCS